jgi:hypothetical protein
MYVQDGFLYLIVTRRKLTVLAAVHLLHRKKNDLMRGYTDNKENIFFLIYKDIQMGSGAKSYMRQGFLIYEEMHKYLTIQYIKGGR